MERIPHRELRNNSAEILRRVADGESFEVTNHGVVVAVLKPPTDDLRDAEIAKRATASDPWRDIPRHKSSISSQQILDELREERL